MWYQKLLYPLTLKVIKEDQSKANLFIDILFKGIHDISSPDPIPAEVLLNLIDRMYKKYEQTSNGSVTLADFSRNLLGLSMVFIKGSFDKAIWNSDFELIWHNKELKRTDLGFTSVGYVREINALERQIHKDLGYSITVDFANLLTIFSKQDIDQLNAIVTDFKSLSGQRQSFDEFISSIEKIITEQKEEQRKLEEQRTLGEQRKLEQDALYSRTKGSTKIMRHIHLTTAQTVNACTLISIAVINAILSAPDELTMEAEIKRVHDESQRLYRESFGGLTNGAGVLETTVYQRYYSNIFKSPISQNVVVPVDNEAFARIIANRDNFLVDNGLDLDLEFFTYNGELVEAIQRLAPTTEINWTTVTEEELRRLVKQDDRLSLMEQFLRVITQLNSQGITIRMEGHTISLVKKGNTYYSYDSLTGDLSVTQHPQEMAEHLAGKTATNRAREALIYYFSPLHSLKLDSQSSIKKEVPPEEQVQHQIEPVATAGLNAERIYDLINNRASFATVDDWQQVNADLFTLIVSQLKGGYLTLKEWATITAEQLCALLNIENNPVPIVSPHVSGLPDSMPPVIEKTGVEDLETHIPDTSIKYAPEQSVHDSEKLIAIIDKLIENMSTQQNGRQTSRNSQWKANLLIDIRWSMRNPDDVDIAQCVADLRTVCAKKRNILHFWAEPHSVSEFERMLRDAEIAIPQANVLIP